jgi:hypothetical protein
MIIKESLYSRLLLGLCLFSVISGCRNSGPSDNSIPGIKIEQIYLWLCNMQQENGLLLSSEGGRYVSLYDNVLAALAFTSQGDLDKAEKIFDFFNGKLESEFFQSPGGFGQLRTADGVPVENSPRRWLGDNAWLLIALNNYHDKAQNTRYHQLATALSNWIISLQDEDGGLWGGFNEKGTRISKIAEGNIDAFNAVAGYQAFHKKLLAYLKNVRWEARNKIFVAWADNPAYRYALDLHSWGYCIFENFPNDILADAKRFETTQKSTATKKLIRGYCFDEDRDVVWLEGTGQMVVAFNKAKRETESQAYIAEMKKNLIPSSRFPGTYALPYTANFGTSYGSDELWEGVDTNPAVSSTVWYLFGIQGFDPLKTGYTKKIPTEDKFWIK